MHYSPLRRSPRIATFRARLACLIHAANVHSEPGSNPSIDIFNALTKPTLRPTQPELRFQLNKFKNLSRWLEASAIAI